MPAPIDAKRIFRIVQLLFVVFGFSPCALDAAESLNVPVERQILVVFDNARIPAKAVDIVSRNTAAAGVPEVLALLGLARRQGGARPVV